MDRESTIARRREWSTGCKRLSVLTAGLLLIAAMVASSGVAQTFNQAISAACLASATVSGNNACGNVQGASSGSPTALTNESSPLEERRVRRLMGRLNVFVSGEYERFDKDVTTFEPGFKTNIGRTVVGADYSFSDNFVLGAAFKYGRDNGHFRGGGHFDIDSYGPLLHVNFVPAPRFFIDGTASYMRKNYSTTREVFLFQAPEFQPRGSAKGDTDGNEFKADVNGGYDFNFQSFTIGPRLGLHYRRTNIDGFRERGDTGQELRYDRQHENSLSSIAGVYASYAISTGFGVLVPQTTLEYVHEFQDPQRRINFRLAKDPDAGKFRFQNDPPDRNYFNLGAGIVAVLPHGFSPFLNYRALVGYKDQSSHIGTAGVRIEF